MDRSKGYAQIAKVILGALEERGWVLVVERVESEKLMVEFVHAIAEGTVVAVKKSKRGGAAAEESR